MSNESRAGPLAGVRVVDCSRVLAGPFATMLLADLGADVVKVEPPAGDETRTWGPPFWGDAADGLSAYYASVNRNKRAITLDLRTAEGQAVLGRLALKADILVHNFRPSTAARLGLSTDHLTTAYPHLVVAAVGGFPGSEKDRERPAYDLLAQAVSGLMWVTGAPDGAPSRVGVALLDLIAGLQIALGSVAALCGRRQQKVNLVETSLVEIGVTSLANVLANYLATGTEPERHGSAHPNIAPYQSFRTRDGYIVVAVGNDAQFTGLLETLRLDHENGRFATNAMRLKHRDELADWLQEAIQAWRRDDLVAELLARDVPAGPVLPVSEAVDAMEQLHDGAWLQAMDGVRLAPNPLRIDGVRAPIRRAPPRLGEHTDEVLRELGLRPEEIEDLRRKHIVR